VGVYEDYAVPHGLMADFATKAEIDINGLPVPEENTNPSMQSSIVALKRRVNEFLSGDNERIASQNLFSSLPKQQERPLTAAAVAEEFRRRQTILEAFEEGNARVAAMYFHNRPCLFPALAPTNNPLPDRYDSYSVTQYPDDAFKIIVHCIKQMAR
jgi:hypothetical protein